MRPGGAFIPSYGINARGSRIYREVSCAASQRVNPSQAGPHLPQRRPNMKEPGLDHRHRDKSSPKAGEIQQKRGDTLNKNLSTPIPEFSPGAKLSTMRDETGENSIKDV